MALAFDTLAYAKQLEAAGIARREAEAHANAARDFIMRDLVTKEDLRLALEVSDQRMTIRLGAMLAAFAALVFGAIKLFI